MKIDEVEIDERDFMEEVKKAMRQRQRYAGHREGGVKPVKERSIVCEFLRAQARDEGCCWIRTVRANSNTNTAPDCFGTNIQGGAVAYEVTELVDKKTIELNLPRIPGQPVLCVTKEWQPQELIQKVQAILERKDNRDFEGAVFERVVLLIHTAEPALAHGAFTNLLTGHTFSKCRKIHEAFLLLPYCPRRKIAPYVHLRLG